MSLRPYEQYKNSGVEWVPILPSHWRHTQLRRIARIFAGGTPDRTNLDYWTDGTVPWLNSGSVNDGSITQPSEWITEEASNGGRTRWVPERSVLIALAGQGKTKGMAARLEFASTCNQSMAAIVPGPDVDYRFVHFWLTANYQNIRNLAGGDLRDGLNLQHVSGISLPLPPSAEQQAIADFLDQETAEIDAFIVDQEELVALLNERRAATITRVVAKGLDPNVPVKDSGVEWIGEVPRHWAVSKVGRFFDVVLGKMLDNGKTAHPAASLLPYIRAANIQDDGLNVSDVNQMYFTPAEAVNLSLKRDDLLVVEGGSVGTCYVVESDMPGWSFQKTVNRVRSKGLASSLFLAYVIRAYRDAGVLSVICNKSTIMHLTAEKLLSLTVPMPSLGEQLRIADYLDSEGAEIDAAIADAKEAIALSRERRAAVISAAVTGKIDVRDRAMTEKTIIQGEPVGVA
jgi:type I restriction enzyme S subunit